MKKRIMILIMSIFTMFSFTACGTDVVVRKDKSITYDVKFIRHEINGTYSILEDANSGVCYLEYDSKYRHALSIMLNPDGTPKIWDN